MYRLKGFCAKALGLKDPAGNWSRLLERRSTSDRKARLPQGWSESPRQRRVRKGLAHTCVFGSLDGWPASGRRGLPEQLCCGPPETSFWFRPRQKLSAGSRESCTQLAVLTGAFGKRQPRRGQWTEPDTSADAYPPAAPVHKICTRSALCCSSGSIRYGLWWIVRVASRNLKVLDSGAMGVGRRRDAQISSHFLLDFSHRSLDQDQAF